MPVITKDLPVHSVSRDAANFYCRLCNLHSLYMGLSQPQKDLGGVPDMLSLGWRERLADYLLSDW